MSLLDTVSAQPTAGDVLFTINDLRRYGHISGVVGPEQEIMVGSDEVNDRLIQIAVLARRLLGSETALPQSFVALMKRCGDNVRNQQGIGLQAIDVGLKCLEQLLLDERILQSA